MKNSKQGHLLRIYVCENDHHEGLPLFEWLVKTAKEEGMAGATVLRGLEGYGAASRIHTAKFLRLAANLPVVIEIVDLREKIEKFTDLIDPVIPSGLATIEKVEIKFYRGGED
jgi:PII-like signaling protein